MDSEKAKCPNTFVADCSKQVKFGSITSDQYTYDINNILLDEATRFSRVQASDRHSNRGKT